MLYTWVFAVFSEIYNVSAMKRLFRPLTIKGRISSSRWERPYVLVSFSHASSRFGGMGLGAGSSVEFRSSMGLSGDFLFSNGKKIMLDTTSVAVMTTPSSAVADWPSNVFPATPRAMPIAKPRLLPILPMAV